MSQTIIPPFNPKIRAISFDVGGTLIEAWPSVGQVYAEVAACFGIKNIAPDWLTKRFSRAWKERADFDYSRDSWFAIVRQSFGAMAEHLPDEYFPAVYERFAEADAWRVYDDVRSTLKMLTRRGVKLGIISNWDDRLRTLLARLELTPYFSSFVISCEIGATKPDPRLFHQAATELAVKPSELLHVGDSYTMDVLGAEKIGAVGRQVMRNSSANKAWQINFLLDLDAMFTAAQA